ncbi:translation elongation factor Ts [Chelatococcus asaccharovorans]|uniref:translation elongation factor Ts n=1 Tax=Chelatococcus asaccharovorans TaxID=28210 RepID=UPI00224C7139|nr:translation elongation factor Ts [Chelatococcus asaccharovorans]CAH1671172.1 protein chain elongation factor EF-Ts [Chelatococcus asaccharovorans]CAH1677417.1 protein chain elongation factor EF-Ts [Chelatococcus asaccharovorans]
MASISAAMVKELRDKTGAGMMDCKTALTETGGDVEAAVDWLRKKGLSKAAKKSGRVAAEGLVAVALAGNKGVVVEINSETDFVARNEQFQQLARTIAKTALDTGTDIEALKAAAYPGGGTIQDALSSAIATIGENMTPRRAASLEVADGVVSAYLHNTSGEGLGRIGVLVALASTGNKDELATLGRQIAMHVAATNPVALDASGVPAETVAREKAILADKHAGKPANVIEKIVDSGMKTYFKEVTLLDQPFIHDQSKTIAQVLKEAEGRLGAPVKLEGFVRYGLGEGIEKEEADFAAEVAAAAGSQG